MILLLLKIKLIINRLNKIPFNVDNINDNIVNNISK